ncbi:lipocalin family protein [Winogradskyella immobilis]|uniref:Lipocalin-like domain-containing protein n=1 Tax=Winogradskyella immobilis TaxID=2816852 RepID=A0ABS8EP56_9FLAO|nr:lipocalin family protein [Winogradskyella immobilis]MCC1484933.1 hypothetical protein [Winogradskyella immobilis]MCG0017025.1 hypothetical protein [Winogradskyella immobilis]
MKRIVLVICFLTVLSCSKNPEIHLKYLNGYWEIEEVTLKTGEKKGYKYNETIDYINVNDSLKGFRKKLNPGFNSKYITSKDAEGITVKIENDSLNLYYKTPYAEWKETVLMANESQLKIINANKDIYLYKRYKSLTLDIE